MSLLGLAQEKRASTTQLQLLASALQDTESARLATKTRQVTAVVNPHCRRDSIRDQELTDSQATPGDEGIRSDVLYVRLDTDRAEEPSLPLEPLFLTRTQDPSPKYQATAADLVLQDEQGNRAHAKSSIIDSGAARCAINYAHLRKWFPNIKMRRTNRAFHDASGNRMNILGEVDLAFWVGDLLLWTVVYVFGNLGHSFLLGVNAINENGLTISSVRSILYSERPEATPDSQVPLAMKLCNVCETVEKSQPDQWNTQAPSSNCDCHRVNLMYHVDEACLKAQARHGEDTHTSKCYQIRAKTLLATPERVTDVRVPHKAKIEPGETVVVPLKYGTLHKGKETTAEVTIDEVFSTKYPTMATLSNTYHSTATLHANVRMRNNGTKTVTLEANDLFGRATYHCRRTPKSQGSLHSVVNSVIEGEAPALQRFKVQTVDRASGLKWHSIGPEPPSEEVAFLDGVHRISKHQQLADPTLEEQLPLKQEFSKAEWSELAIKKQLLMTHYIRGNDGMCYVPTEVLPFNEGGRPRSIADLHEIGFSLEKAIDPSQPRQKDGSYPPLSQELKAELYQIALDFWYVWSRDARAPEISRLVVIDVPTGNATPIAQKPYPIPYAYLEAARDELQKLLDAGLIEPCISNWASPVLVRLKKDSTPEAVRLKLICDFRRLNEVTVPDAAGLGDQEEILDGFGGDQRWSGIVDAAGGFYQLLINPRHRFRTAICLPTSMGGTQFQWRVAPYGLTRNPAGYSRGMMFALKGLNDCSLDNGNAKGGAASWIDDVSMHANSFAGFKDLFRKILTRLAFAGMSLKATKCYLLHQELEVLGFFVTPDGIIMQPKALESIEKCGRTIERRDDSGKIIGPSTVKEIRIFLGAVQFYRRFVPRIAMLAAPMNELLRKAAPDDPKFRPGEPEHTKAWDSVQQSFEAIMMFLRSSAVVSAPDLRDPRAEFIIVGDACDVAAGGALLQWQYPGSNGPGPPAGTPLRGGLGPDPITQSWRLAAGWKLRTIGYFHKTFNSAQINYPTFDQEGAAILTCCRRWAKLITGRPTTIYTDSSVAATMLTKHMGTMRLATWGIELGPFMPFLKIQHRKGSQNGLADFISRYPTFAKYIKRPRDELQLPPGVFDRVATVPLFTHEVADEEERSILKGWRIDLVETANTTEAEKFWNKPENLAAIEEVLQGCSDPDSFMDQVMALKATAQKEDFWREQHEFDEYVHEWEIYSDIFQATHNRKPVLWDLCCGEGGYSRGAQTSGLECHGFDLKPECKHRYEHDPAPEGQEMLTSMHFHEADILTDAFWDTLMASDKTSLIPLPDIIHISPPCSQYSRLSAVGGDRPLDGTWTLNFLIRKLKAYARHCEAHYGRHVIWQIESVIDSKKYVSETVDTVVMLCGTMMGHQTFRHRLFYCNYPAVTPHQCRHEGKLVGSHGVRFNAKHNEERFGHLPEANMYGIYSRPYSARGTADEWHGALGHLPGTFTEKGLRGALPTGYGRLLSGQAIAHSLHRQFACPVLPPYERESHEISALETWACQGFKPLSDSHAIATLPIEDYPSVLEAAWPDNTKLNDLIAAIWAPCTIAIMSPDTPARHDRRTSTVDQGMERTPERAAIESTVHTHAPHQPRVRPGMVAPPLDLPPEAAIVRQIPPSPTCYEAAEADEFNPYIITRAEQLADPSISPILQRLEQSAKTSTKTEPVWKVIGGRLFRQGFSAVHEPINQVYVPAARRARLLEQYHYSNHRGGGPLEDELSKSYYWPNMASDCTTFSTTCEVCAPIAAAPLNKVVTNPIPTPARPFTVLHVDHADFRGRVSGPRKYQYILVVTCALTRFTMFIPTTDSTAESTLKDLNRMVFCIFGPPLIVVSDNGPAFISDLSKTCAWFWGYRHIHILPYNSQANGTVESAVKRIKLLLDRHCAGHANWHVQLPVLQLKLNTDKHTGTGVSPYVALFGRDPVGIEQLEDPSLYPETHDGHGFLHDLRGRLTASHETLRLHSDALKKAHADEQNMRKNASADPERHGIVEASTDQQSKYAWLIHGSKQQAAYIAKHGHGLPWKHKYKVLETRPHSVRLLVPTDGSVPRVNEWQLRRRVARAPAHSHGPGANAPVITEAGLRMPGIAEPPADTQVDGDPFAGDEQEYDIDKVEYAQKVGRYYKIWIRWQGHAKLTWRWRHELVAETTNAEVLQQIETAVAAERQRVATTTTDAYAEQEEDFNEEVPADVLSETAAPQPLGRGAPRDRKAPTRFAFAMLETSTALARAVGEVRSIACRSLRACTHYLAPAHTIF